MWIFKAILFSIAFIQLVFNAYVKLILNLLFGELYSWDKFCLAFVCVCVPVCTYVQVCACLPKEKADMVFRA